MEKAIATQVKSEDWEIDWRLLKMGEKIAAGSCGDLLVCCNILKFIRSLSPNLPSCLHFQCFLIQGIVEYILVKMLLLRSLGLSI